MKRKLLAVTFAAMLTATPAFAQNAVPGAAYSDEVAAAIALVNGGRYGDAVAQLTYAAEANNVDAQVMLGLIYLHGSFAAGQEVKMDLEAATYWFSRAAASGSSIAQFLLAKVNAMGASAVGVNGGGDTRPVIQAPTRRFQQP